jgi:hypothetical protein
MAAAVTIGLAGCGTKRLSASAQQKIREQNQKLLRPKPPVPPCSILTKREVEAAVGGPVKVVRQYENCAYIETTKREVRTIVISPTVPKRDFHPQPDPHEYTKLLNIRGPGFRGQAFNPKAVFDQSPTWEAAPGWILKGHIYIGIDVQGQFKIGTRRSELRYATAITRSIGKHFHPPKTHINPKDY